MAGPPTGRRSQVYLRQDPVFLLTSTCAGDQASRRHVSLIGTLFVLMEGRWLTQHIQNVVTSEQRTGTG